MFEAQILMAGTSVFSPWFPRGGDNVTCTVDVVAQNTSQVTVQLFTKDSEDSGEGTDSNVSVFILSTGSVGGRFNQTWESKSTASPKANIDELVRYKFTAGGEGADEWVMFRMLTPVWFDDVTA